MTNEEFQKAVLGELKGLNTKTDKMEANQNEMSKKINTMETRQDEIYKVVTAIEHSNPVGRSELDNQNVRLSKVEGKLKKTARIYNDEVEIEIASNL